MIPLVYCNSNLGQDSLWTVVIVGAVVAVGILGGRSAKPAAILAVCLIGLLLPTAAIFELWPIKVVTAESCGVTPDPTLTVVAVFLSPLLMAVAYFCSRRSKLPRA